LAQEANRAYQRACRDGEVRACYAEADVLLNARTIREDLPRALTLLEQSCRDGYALSCVRVGELRERGRQASKLVPSAMRVTPDGESQPFMMSVPDPSQPGIAADVGLSIAAYRAACALGESAECLRAARVALESQASAPPERQRAIEDLQKFCASGQAFACELLAQQAAASGGAIAGNTAAQWRRRACVLGERGSCDD
jgi:TPR repeat protein